MDKKRSRIILMWEPQGNESFWRSRTVSEYNSNLSYRKRICGRGQSTDKAGCFEYGNELSDSVKSGRFFE